MCGFSTALVMIGSIAISSTIILLNLKLPNIDFHHEKLIPERARNFTSNPKQLRLDDQPTHLFWFIQISGIRNQPRGPVHDFARFVTETLDTIKPSVVLATGDLTDYESGQDEKGWKIYSELLTKGNVRNKTLWLDLRSVNDIFKSSNRTFFERYSVQGSQHKRSYMKLVQGNGDLYSFIAVDAFPEPRLKYPFNMVGILTEGDQNELHELQEESRQAGADYTIWFGQYATSFVVTPREETDGLRSIISNRENSLAYMCGYDIGEWSPTLQRIPRMYTLQNDSFLELGVDDWMDNRRFRVAAIDNGLLSFVDVQHGDWPIVLITNPKHSLFQLPYRQEAKLQLESTHIRLLAFSPAGIKSCVVQIDEDFKRECTRVNDNLFVVEWDPEKYKNGIHYITATVVDDYGRENQVTQPFRLDNMQSLSFDYLARLYLETRFDILYKCAFYMFLVLLIVPSIVLRIWHQLILAGIFSPIKTYRPSAFFPSEFVDRIFWPIFLYSIYIAIGPWGICEVFDGEYGVLFIWGVYINGNFFPSYKSYRIATKQILVCLMLVNNLSLQAIHKYHRVADQQAPMNMCLVYRILYGIGFCITICDQISVFSHTGVYGYSMWLGPFTLWPIVMFFPLHRFVQNVPDEFFKPVVYAWNAREKPTTNIEKRKIDRIRRKIWLPQKET